MSDPPRFANAQTAYNQAETGRTRDSYEQELARVRAQVRTLREVVREAALHLYTKQDADRVRELARDVLESTKEN